MTMQIMNRWCGIMPPFVRDGKYTCICDLHSTYLFWRQKALDKLSKSCAPLSLFTLKAPRGISNFDNSPGTPL